MQDLWLLFSMKLKYIYRQSVSFSTFAYDIIEDLVVYRVSYGTFPLPLFTS